MPFVMGINQSRGKIPSEIPILLGRAKELGNGIEHKATPMKRIRRNLFRRGKTYYFLHRVDGKQRKISLQTTDLNKARKLADELAARSVMAKIGIGRPATLQTRFRSIESVVDFYLDAGCPRKDSSPREGRALTMEKKWIEKLREHLGNKEPSTLTPDDWVTYVAKRRTEFKAGKGDRTIDMEWNALSSAFRWARQHPAKTGITSHPLPERPILQRKASAVEHCRDFQPENADELHRIAAHFMKPDSESVVFGWLTLLSSMIGQRCAEMLRLRSDAKRPIDPGFDDGEHLWLYRSKTHKGTAPFIKIGPELRECLNARAEWARKAFPENPWMFPSPRIPGAVLDLSSFNRALRRTVKELGLPKRTAHGLRSYFVNVLRSREMPDSQIALQIGHKSGGKLIIETYGEILPIKLGWTPEGEPAWKRWTSEGTIAKPIFA